MITGGMPMPPSLSLCGDCQDDCQLRRLMPLCSDSRGRAERSTCGDGRQRTALDGRGTVEVRQSVDPRPTAISTATRADRGDPRRAAAPEVPRSKTPANGSELGKQSLKIGALLAQPSGAAGLPARPLAHSLLSRCAYSWTSRHTSVARMQVRRTTLDTSVRRGTGWPGSNPGSLPPPLSADHRLTRSSRR
jgi:hypothetical protein